MMLAKKGKEGDLKREMLAQKKIDGVRCIAYCDSQGIKLLGRSGKDYTAKFPEIVAELQGINAILDGEIACETFQATQSRTLTQNKIKSQLLAKQHPAKYYIFDILKHYDDNLMNKPLHKRVGILCEMFSPEFFIYGASIELLRYYTEPKELWEKAKKENWEGVMLKNPESHYVSGRSSEWLKLKTTKTKDLKFYTYSENPAGVRAETKDEIAIQISGNQAEVFKQQHSRLGYAVVEVEYLEQFTNGKLRQPVCKEVKC